MFRWISTRVLRAEKVLLIWTRNYVFCTLFCKLSLLIIFSVKREVVPFGRRLLPLDFTVFFCLTLVRLQGLGTGLSCLSKDKKVLFAMYSCRCLKHTVDLSLKRYRHCVARAVLSSSAVSLNPVPHGLLKFFVKDVVLPKRFGNFNTSPASIVNEGFLGASYIRCVRNERVGTIFRGVVL